MSSHTQKPKTVKAARLLRNRQTDAEALLWSKLRNRQLFGLKFRRQHPIVPYVIDFYCHAHQLAIEVDGSQHLTKTGHAQDQN